MSELTLSPRIRRFALLSLASALVTGCATVQRDKDRAEYHQRIGTALLQQGHYPEALRELLQAEKLNSRDASIQNNLGLAYFMRERPDLAAIHLEKAVDINPSFSEARNNYGRVLVELGKYPQAIEQLQRVIDDLTYTDPAKANVNLGLAQFRSGDYAKAKGSFANAIRINRENCLAYAYYGRTLFELNEFKNAANALDNAVIICKNSKMDEPHYFSGLAYYKLGKTSNAVARMEELVKLYPSGKYAKKAESLLKLMK
ncbi:MAG TPA: tetratricopeptide repeat protein [Bdellovibrionales bacterium]|nr:tetratricopeptide repeat protein [Bdellovibrionales bacterium]